MSSKGQSFMPDFLASLAIFGIIISFFLFAWNGVISNQGDFSGSENLRQEASYTATFLVSTPGYPPDWNETNVEIPGFASSSDNVLEEKKLKEFRNISYSQQKLLLKAPDFYLRMGNSSTVFEMEGEPLEFGKEPVNASTATVINRNVILNLSSGTKSGRMQYVAWR